MSDIADSLAELISLVMVDRGPKIDFSNSLVSVKGYQDPTHSTLADHG